VSSLGEERVFFKSEERILGVSGFVTNVPVEAEGAMERKAALISRPPWITARISIRSSAPMIR